MIMVVRRVSARLSGTPLLSPNCMCTGLQFDLAHRIGLAVFRVDFKTADGHDSIALPPAQDCRGFLVGQRWISCLFGLAMG
jgi:hypothetical protein